MNIHRTMMWITLMLIFGVLVDIVSDYQTGFNSSNNSSNNLLFLSFNCHDTVKYSKLVKKMCGQSAGYNAGAGLIAAGAVRVG